MDFDAHFDSLWESILDVGREPATGGYRDSPGTPPISRCANGSPPKRSVAA